MFGFECNETSTLIPLLIYLAHKLTQQSELRKNGTISWLHPDAESQVTIKYSHGKPKRVVGTLRISTQHVPDVSQIGIIETVIEQITMLAARSEEKTTQGWIALLKYSSLPDLVTV